MDIYDVLARVNLFLVRKWLSQAGSLSASCGANPIPQRSRSVSFSPVTFFSISLYPKLSRRKVALVRRAFEPARRTIGARLREQEDGR